MSKEKLFRLTDAHQEFAKRANHRVWELLEKPARTAEEKEELVITANASLYHWIQAGGAVESQRGHWLLSRVYVVLGRVQDALDQALKCGSITESHPDEMADFDLAYSREALARAYVLAGDFKQADEHLKAAEILGQAIKDAKDQEIFLGDLNSGDWYGIK